MANKYWLLLAAGLAMGGSALAQVGPDPAVGLTPPEAEVEGATPDRVARIEQCQGHKFDTMVQIDPARNRSTRVKLCADPGATHSDWVKTLEDAIDQIEGRDMPLEAKAKVVAELRQEISKFSSVARPVTDIAPSTTTSSGAAFAGNLGEMRSMTGPSERFETSKLPPLPPPLPRKPVAIATGAEVVGAVPSPPAMRFQVKCLARGETGAGTMCHFWEPGISLALSAVEGMEKGAKLRFLRRGKARGEVMLAPLAAGKFVRVRLPTELCRGVAFTRVELELLPPSSPTTVAARAGPYYLRC